MGKLVRDRIPEIIRADGGVPTTRLLSGDDYAAALLSKAVEEAVELREAASVEERLSEAADVFEVLRAIAELCGVTIDDVARRAAHKRESRGGFAMRVWLD